jgi:hypothetical protein
MAEEIGAALERGVVVRDLTHLGAHPPRRFVRVRREKPASLPPPALLAAEMQLAIGTLGFFSGEWESHDAGVRFRAKWDRERDRERWVPPNLTAWHAAIDDVLREVIEACKRLDAAAPELTGGCGGG